MDYQPRSQVPCLQCIRLFDYKQQSKTERAIMELKKLKIKKRVPTFAACFEAAQRRVN